jgi:glycosyltransferase involved in cell wall biosynthesis
LSGSGLQFKVLQTMAVGTPVVTTSIVARALYAEDGKHLLIADKADDFAEAVLLLMREKRLQRSLSVNGRQWVEHNHNWSRIAQKLEHIYFDLLDA